MTSRTENFRAPLARLSRTNLFVPRKREGKPDKYEVNLIFPKATDLAEMKRAILQAAKDEWGDKAENLLKAGAIKQPILDGDGPQGVSKKTGERYKELEGMYFVRLSSNLQPALFSKKMTAAVDGADLYSGSYGYAVVNAYTWENAENGRGVSIGLSMVQMVRDGEKLGGGAADPTKFFEAIEDSGEAGDGGTGDGAGALFS
jgi:hypothetical protein